MSRQPDGSALLHCFGCNASLAEFVTALDLDDSDRINARAFEEARLPRISRRSNALDLAAAQARFRAALTAAQTGELSLRLGVPESSLVALGLGWASPLELRALGAGFGGGGEFPNGAYAFPTVDGKRRQVGFSLRAIDGRKGGPSGLPLGLVVTSDFDGHSGPVLCVEGASDVAALHARGLRAVGRPSNSAGSAFLAELLRHEREVIVLGENDRKADGTWPGRTGAEKVARELADAWKRPVPYALPPEGRKDAREWLASDTRDAGGLLDTIRAASQSETHARRSAEPDSGRVRFVRARDVEPREVRWLWPDLIPLGKVSLLAGPGGLGKSTVAVDLAARVSNGTAAPDGSPLAPANVVLIACEEDAGDTLRPKLDAVGANVDRVHIATTPLSLPGDGAQLAAKVREIGNVGLVIVDTIGDVLGKSDENKNAEVRAAIAPLRELAEELGAAVILVAHLRKSGGSTIPNRILGSVAFANVARSVLVVVKDRDDPDARLLAVVKSNLARVGQSAFRFRLGGSPLRVEWLGQCETSEDDLAALLESPASGGIALRQAEESLRSWLVNGPLRQSEVDQRAKAAGIAFRTLQRAKESIGARSRKLEFAGAWEWFLPNDSGAKSAKL